MPGGSRQAVKERASLRIRTHIFPYLFVVNHQQMFGWEVTQPPGQLIGVQPATHQALNRELVHTRFAEGLLLLWGSKQQLQITSCLKLGIRAHTIRLIRREGLVIPQRSYRNRSYKEHVTLSFTRYGLRRGHTSTSDSYKVGTRNEAGLTVRTSARPLYVPHGFTTQPKQSFQERRRGSSSSPPTGTTLFPSSKEQPLDLMA